MNPILLAFWSVRYGEALTKKDDPAAAALVRDLGSDPPDMDDYKRRLFLNGKLLNVVRFGLPETAAALLDIGASHATVDHRGYTPMRIAAHEAVTSDVYPALAMVDLLLSRGGPRRRFSLVDEHVGDSLWAVAKATRHRPEVAAAILRAGHPLRDHHLADLLANLCAETSHVPLMEAMLEHGRDKELRHAVDFLRTGDRREPRAHTLAAFLAAHDARAAAEQVLLVARP